jgi:hypothetical protein
LAQEQRRLAAIVAADGVGYSRLMARYESGTLVRLRQNRADRPRPTATSPQTMRSYSAWACLSATSSSMEKISTAMA